VFPQGTVWSNYLNGDGYDLVLMGRLDTSAINIDEVQKRLEAPQYSRVAASLDDVRITSAADLFAAYTGRASDLSSMLLGVQVNRDLNMRLQYIAGWGVNSVSADEIYRNILSHRTFPDGLLEGTRDRIETLRDVLSRKHRVF